MIESHDVSMSYKATKFFEVLDYEFNRSRRYGNALTLVFVKLARPDSSTSPPRPMVREINRLIRENIRRTDRDFIYGEDEFMIILPHTPEEGARCMMSKLKLLIENYTFEPGDGTPVTLMPKFGIASYPQGVCSREGAAKLADMVA